MADLGEVNKIPGVFGGAQLGGIDTECTEAGCGEVGCQDKQEQQMQENAGTIRQAGCNLPTKVGFWNKFKTFWLQDIDWNKEIRVELTPRQQRIENEINEFLHQEITWEKVHDFLFQEVTFRSKK